MSKKIIALTVLALMLAGCGGDGGPGSGSLESLRPKGQTAPPQATSTPAATAVPQIGTVIQTVVVAVVATQPVEVTREVVIVVTATPEIVNFEPGIDESVQPCPLKYWKRGRCTATQEQLDQAAKESQP